MRESDGRACYVPLFAPIFRSQPPHRRTASPASAQDAQTLRGAHPSACVSVSAILAALFLSVPAAIPLRCDLFLWHERPSAHLFLRARALIVLASRHCFWQNPAQPAKACHPQQMPAPQTALAFPPRDQLAQPPNPTTTQPNDADWHRCAPLLGCAPNQRHLTRDTACWKNFSANVSALWVATLPYQFQPKNRLQEDDWTLLLSCFLLAGNTRQHFVAQGTGCQRKLQRQTRIEIRLRHSSCERAHTQNITLPFCHRNCMACIQ